MSFSTGPRARAIFFQNCGRPHQRILGTLLLVVLVCWLLFALQLSVCIDQGTIFYLIFIFLTNCILGVFFVQKRLVKVFMQKLEESRKIINNLLVEVWSFRIHL